MSSRVRKVLDELYTLSPSERAAVSAELRGGAEVESDDAVEQAWRDEILRRLKEIESGEVELIAGEEIEQRLRKIIGD